jgi:hypothetical protein
VAIVAIDEKSVRLVAKERLELVLSIFPTKTEKPPRADQISPFHREPPSAKVVASPASRSQRENSSFHEVPRDDSCVEQLKTALVLLLRSMEILRRLLALFRIGRTALLALNLHSKCSTICTNCEWVFVLARDNEMAILLISLLDDARRMNLLDPRGYLTGKCDGVCPPFRVGSHGCRALDGSNA